MNQRAESRTLGLRLADRLVTKYFRLPAPTSDYSITRNVRIPMRDGVELLADVLAPKGRSLGTLLITSCYGTGIGGTAMTGAVFGSRGYRVVMVRCRGTFGSGGTFEPFSQEADDAPDIVAWMRDQSWFDGRFATHGYSYLGFTQWALLMDPPPELVTAVIACAPHDFGAFAYTGGAFLLSTLLEWSFVVTHQEDPILRRMTVVPFARDRIRKAMVGLPLVDAAEGLLGGRAPWYRQWISRRDMNDPLWERANLTKALEQVRIPVLLQDGWQDGFLRQAVAGYGRLAERGVNVGLTVGPWTHAQGGAKGGRVLLPEALEWFDEHLAESGIRHRATPVRVFVSGPNGGWRDLQVWPPATVEQILYPRSSKLLAARPSDPGEVGEFTYDPADPTPTYGGAFVTQAATLAAGYQDDSALAARPDQLTFTSEPLTTDLEVIGSPIVDVGHKSDNPFADLFVRLSEVNPRGRSRNVSDGFVRLNPSNASSLVRLELDAIAHRFAQGSRIRLIIAGGSHPRWERNLGTSDDPASSARTAPSRRTIDLAVSRVVLPVIRTVAH